MNIDIVTALEDPKLLGQFISQDSWAAWKCLFRAAYALPPADGDIDLYRKCTNRDEWPRERCKELVILAGRRSGKTLNAALLVSHAAAFQEYPMLRAGERATCALVAPTKAQALVAKRHVEEIFQSNALLQSMVRRDSTWELSLAGNVDISVMPSDYRTVRGISSPMVVLDESAFFNVEGEKPISEIIRAFQPALLTMDGMLVMITSVYARRGYDYEAFRDHFGVNHSPVLVWKADSLTMNPTLDAGAIERALKADPEGARAEYLSEFRSDISQFLDYRQIEVCVVAGRKQLPFVSGYRYMFFADPSGGRHDAFVGGGAHHDGYRVVVDWLKRIVPPFNPSDAAQEIATLIKAYNGSEVFIDHYAAEWVVNAFAECGVLARPINTRKSELYMTLEPMLNTEAIELLDDPVLVKELSNLERKTGRSGQDSIDHPPHGSDDVANVVAGLAHLLYQEPPEVQIRTIHRNGKPPLEWMVIGPHASYALRKEFELASGYQFCRLDGDPPFNTGRVFSLKEFRAIYEKAHGRAKWRETAGGAVYVNW